MTASEFAFLALGLILGVAAGAALVETLRARPPAPREVRLTVTTDAVPRRRSATLADDGFVVAGGEPARGGPADRRATPVPVPPGEVERRTAVRSGDPLDGGGATVDPPHNGRVDHDGSASVVGQPGRIAIPVSQGSDPTLDALRRTAAVAAVAAAADPPGGRRPTTVPTSGQASTIVTATSTADRPVSAADAAPGQDPGPGAAAATGAPDAGGSGAAAASDATASGGEPAGPCSEARRVVDERCELATRARSQAAVAQDALRDAQRAYDDHERQADVAASAADPRAIRRAKDEAQARFRTARGGSLTQEEVETAARAWLAEVNLINNDARDATATMTREREAARKLAANMERLALETDAARIGAETAEAACMAARVALADCEERAVAGDLGSHRPAVPVDASIETPLEEPLAASYRSGRSPRIFRLVRGDRSAMTEIVTTLGGADPEERRRWQAAVSDLVDAIMASSIEATVLDFPDDAPFWGPFTPSQHREIAAALSSLGYRFDGQGGWVDDRVPSQRDLSLALGYAGLDPMRMRHWPNEAEMQALFRDVTVAADEHLAAQAGDLSLGELVTMLGRRADGLTDVWNQWGRLRPMLLEEA